MPSTPAGKAPLFAVLLSRATFKINVTLSIAASKREPLRGDAAMHIFAALAAPQFLNFGLNPQRLTAMTEPTNSALQSLTFSVRSVRSVRKAGSGLGLRLGAVGCTPIKVGVLAVCTGRRRCLRRFNRAVLLGNRYQARAISVVLGSAERDRDADLAEGWRE